MLLTRIGTALVLLALLLAVLYSESFVVFVAVSAAFLAGAVWESARLFHASRPFFNAAIWTVAYLAVVAQSEAGAPTMLLALCVAIWTFRFLPALAFGLPPLTGVGNHLLSAFYGIAVLGCFIAIVILFKHSPLYLVSVMAIVWVADIGAYFAGKAFGKRKLAPSISPGKSWEGAAGGWLMVLLLAGASIGYEPFGDTFAVQLHARLGWVGFFVVMTLLVAASVVGDLFESQLKRRAGLKDSSRLLPGHGGVLDRIDALIPALPLAVLAGTWL